MHKDSNLRKRNALVIPGGLLLLYGLIGVVYVVALRGDEGTCGDASLVIFLGACRSALLVLAIPLVIGFAMVTVGALAFRNQSTCRAGHGSWAHFGLAFLISLALLPLLALLILPSLVGPDAAITRGGVDYPISTVLGGGTALGLAMLLPFALLYAARKRANPCCRERGCFDPCFCDEPAAEAPVEPATEVVAAPVVEPAPAIVPVPAPLPPPPEPVPPLPAPETKADDEWKTVADEKPAEQWEVLPDEPKAEAKAPARAAPPLATRPTDPAAPPADAMAVAAKWAEEDAEAERELKGESASRRGRLAKAAKKTAADRKAGAKQAKKAKK